MMIEQYRPQVPDPGNALHQLQKLRIDARHDADMSWQRFRQKAHDTLHPRPAKAHRTFVGTLLAHAQTIATGAVIGARVITVFKSLRQKK